MSAGPDAGLAQVGPILEAGGPELSRLLGLVERRLGEAAESGGPELGRHAGATLSAGGKRLRPLLVCLAGGLDSSEHLVRGAAAVELLHTATLVHDDVLDRASLRRGRTTVFAAAGRTAAATTGDYLFSCAFTGLAGTGHGGAVRALSDASSALARGELLQRADAWSANVTRERYLERCTLKTAKLFEAACRLGAILGSPGAGSAAALGRFGERIGLAFQIFDDVLDVSGPTSRTGKQRGADLLDGTVTLPLIVARERDPELVALDLRQVVTEPAQAAAFCDRIALTGALDACRMEALGHVAEAKAALTDIDLAESRRRALELVADGVVERYA